MTTNITCLDERTPTSTAEWPPSARHGAMTRSDAERLLGPAELAAGLADGEWVQPWHGVVVPAARAHDPMTRAAAALLRAGPYSVLSGPTAVAMHGCGPTDVVVDVTIPYDREVRSQPDLTVHQAWVRECDVVELDGLRTQALDFAITELLCISDQRQALDCLELALGQLGEHAEHFRELVAERVARRRDRRGTRRASALLGLAWPKPNSALTVGIGGAR